MWLQEVGVGREERGGKKGGRGGGRRAGGGKPAHPAVSAHPRMSRSNTVASTNIMCRRGINFTPFHPQFLTTMHSYPGPRDSCLVATMVRVRASDCGNLTSFT